jgi:D-3-phosphoglycerate dehydrogenase
MNHSYIRSPNMVPQPIPIASSSPRVVATSVSPAPHSPFLRHRDSLVSLDAIRQPRVLHPIDNEDLRLLLLENISPEAVLYFRSQGFHVDHYATAFSEAELLEKIPHYHAVGIRSKTQITEKIIKAATKACIIRSAVSFFLPLHASIASCHRLFLHWDQPSRPRHGSQGWHPCL